MIKPPVAAGTAGQASVTAMAGAVVIGQVVEPMLVTGVPVQVSLPVARQGGGDGAGVGRNGETGGEVGGRAGRQRGHREHRRVGRGPITDHDDVRSR